MNCVLKRDKYGFYGIFGRIFDEQNNWIAYTLEHAYPEGEPTLWVPKVSVGTYSCVRHQSNRLPYETFELQNVPDFKLQPVTGILIHKGNYSSDSEGCILLGNSLGTGCILDSKFAFGKFMQLQEGVNEFTLIVS